MAEYVIDINPYLEKKIARVKEINELMGSLDEERLGLLEDIKSSTASFLLNARPVSRNVKPKVGDRVECIDNRDYSDLSIVLFGMKIGDEGEVLSVDPGFDFEPETFCVRWEDGYNFYHTENQLSVI